jgi:hypothetical protein
LARVAFVDTSVLLNMLDVPQRNADRSVVLAELPARQEEGQLILPITTIIETDNHISQVAGGHARRECAKRFSSMLELVIADRAPFVVHEVGWDRDFLSALVMGGTSGSTLVEHLATAVIGCGDLSILVERDRYLSRVAASTEASIWSLDAGLQAHA